MGKQIRSKSIFLHSFLHSSQGLTFSQAEPPESSRVECGSHEWGEIVRAFHCSLPPMVGGQSILFQSRSSHIWPSLSCSLLALHLKGSHLGINVTHGVLELEGTYHWFFLTEKEEEKCKGRRKKGLSYTQYCNICNGLYSQSLLILTTICKKRVFITILVL